MKFVMMTLLALTSMNAHAVIQYGKIDLTHDVLSRAEEFEDFLNMGEDIGDGFDFEIPTATLDRDQRSLTAKITEKGDPSDICRVASIRRGPKMTVIRVLAGPGWDDGYCMLEIRAKTNVLRSNKLWKFEIRRIGG